MKIGRNAAIVPVSMMANLKIGFAIPFLLLQLSAARADDGGQFRTFGVGLSSCATWLNNPASKAVGDQWVLGFWSGSNAGSQHSVGRNTDARGALAEVRLICAAQPSLALGLAVNKVWMRMYASGQ